MVSLGPVSVEYRCIFYLFPPTRTSDDAPQKPHIEKGDDISILIDCLSSRRKSSIIMTSYDDYMQYLDQLGESILQWADPKHEFRGFTDVRW